MDNIDTLISCYFAPTLCQDQLEYLCMTTKPFQMTCEQLGSRLCIISHLGHYLPGSIVGGICFDLFFTEDALKHAYSLLMPAFWKIKFAESGQILNNIICATRIVFGSWRFKKPFPSACKKISQTNGRLRDIQVVVDVVVAEIVSVAVEVVPATVVGTSPVEDVAVIIMLLTLLILLLVLLPLLKDVVLFPRSWSWTEWSCGLPC